MRVLLVVPYGYNEPTFAATQLAEWLKNHGLDPVLLSITKPIGGVDRFWDSRVLPVREAKSKFLKESRLVIWFKDVSLRLLELFRAACVRQVWLPSSASLRSSPFAANYMASVICCNSTIYQAARQLLGFKQALLQKLDWSTPLSPRLWVRQPQLRVLLDLTGAAHRSTTVAAAEGLTHWAVKSKDNRAAILYADSGYGWTGWLRRYGNTNGVTVYCRRSLTEQLSVGSVFNVVMNLAGMPYLRLVTTALQCSGAVSLYCSADNADMGFDAMASMQAVLPTAGTVHSADSRADYASKLCQSLELLSSINQLESMQEQLPMILDLRARRFYTFWGEHLELACRAH